MLEKMEKQLHQSINLEERERCIHLLEDERTVEAIPQILISYLLFSLENLLEPLSEEANGIHYDVNPKIPYKKENVNSYGTNQRNYGLTIYTENDNKNAQVLIDIVFDEKAGIFYIPTIFLHKSMVHKGVGKRMIKICYLVAKEFNCKVQIVQMVDSFRERLLRRGATPIGFDCVEITDSTDLSIHNY